MFSLILLFCLTFTIPLGKLFDVFYWNNQIIPIETTHSFKEYNTHTTLRLSAKHFKVEQSSKSEYFFQIKFLPLIEKCLISFVSLIFLNQNILFSEHHKDSIYQNVFNVFYPNEKMI